MISAHIQNRSTCWLIAGLLIGLSGCTKMTTLTRTSFDVYVDNKPTDSISVYKLNDDEYIVLLSDYSVDGDNDKGVYYLNLAKKRVYLLIGVKKLEIQDKGKTMKINTSSMKDLWILQVVDHSKKTLKITNDEIKFTPNLDLITEGINPDRIDKKEVILRKRQTNQ